MFPFLVSPNIEHHLFIYLNSCILIARSEVTFIKLNEISYSALLSNAVMTASLVQELPVLISKALDISIDSVIVVSITGASNVNARKRSDSGANGVVVAVAIPDENVDELKIIIKSPNSTLYSPSNGQLPTFIDRNYPVTNGKSGNLFNRIFSS